VSCPERFREAIVDQHGVEWVQVMVEKTSRKARTFRHFVDTRSFSLIPQDALELASAEVKL
jgi:hypothetical protein